MNDRYLCSYKELKKNTIERILYKTKKKNEFEWFVFGMEQLSLASEDINKITIDNDYILGEHAFFSMRNHKVYSISKYRA